MLEQIRKNCALLQSPDLASYMAARAWLMDCRPFKNVLDRLREHELNIFQVATILAPDSDRPLTETALALLQEEIGNALRDTAPIDLRDTKAF